MKTRFVTPLLLSLLALTTGAAAQGNKILFSFHGGPTTGKDSTGGNSKTGVVVAGFGNTIVEPGAGATNEQVADQVDAALKAKGFKTSRPNKNEICVEAGPGGKPLTKGGGIGDTDTGLGGINVKVKKPAAPAPAVKPAGVGIPKFVPGLRARIGGILRWLIDVIDPNGKPRQHQLQLPFQQGESTDQLNQRMQQMLQQGRFHLGTCFYPDVFQPQNVIEFWQLDRMWDGSRIEHVVMQGEIPIELLSMQLQGGASPLFGAVEYGTGFGGAALPFDPWMRPGINPPKIGTQFDVFVEVGAPGLLGGCLVSGNKAEIPLSFLGPNAFLLVDPLQTLWLPGLTDPFGVMQLQVPIPPNPQLAGLDLAWQALVVTPQQGLAVSSGLQTVLGK